MEDKLKKKDIIRALQADNEDLRRRIANLEVLLNQTTTVSGGPWEWVTTSAGSIQ